MVTVVLLVVAVGLACGVAAVVLARLRTLSSRVRCASGRSLLPLRRKAWVRGVPSSGMLGGGLKAGSGLGGKGSLAGVRLERAHMRSGIRGEGAQKFWDACPISGL